MTDGFSALTADVLQQRHYIRGQALAARIALPAETRETLTRQLEGQLDALVAHLDPISLGFCWPYRAEPDLRGWVQRWLAGSARRLAALPVVLDKDRPLVFRPWTTSVPMKADRHGIPHPVLGAEVLPEVLLVPLNAFDAQGFRLGYGGGYFDRTLAAHRVLAVGVGFELGRVDTVYPQDHDKPMDWLVTEAGSWSCAAARNVRPGPVSTAGDRG